VGDLLINFDEKSKLIMRDPIIHKKLHRKMLASSLYFLSPPACTLIGEMGGGESFYPICDEIITGLSVGMPNRQSSLAATRILEM